MMAKCCEIVNKCTTVDQVEYININLCKYCSIKISSIYDMEDAPTSIREVYLENKMMDKNYTLKEVRC